MLMNDNLPLLRDIHLPEHDVSMWPLAAGWWGLLTLIIGSFVLIKVFFWLRRKSAKVYALHVLNKISSDNCVAAIAQMSVLLRRVCVWHYSEAVALSGVDWVEFLNSKTSYKLDEKSAKLLLHAPFIAENNSMYSKQDVEKLRHFCSVWLGENL